MDHSHQETSSKDEVGSYDIRYSFPLAIPVHQAKISIHECATFSVIDGTRDNEGDDDDDYTNDYMIDFMEDIADGNPGPLETDPR